MLWYYLVPNAMLVHEQCPSEIYIKHPNPAPSYYTFERRKRHPIIEILYMLQISIA